VQNFAGPLLEEPFPAEDVDKTLKLWPQGHVVWAMEASILSVDRPDQHIRHTRRFKIGVDGY
jgi:hypothetical protein